MQWVYHHKHIVFFLSIKLLLPIQKNYLYNTYIYIYIYIISILSFYNLLKLLIDSNRLLYNAFVMISTSWPSDFTNGVAIAPFRILSLTKWQSTSITRYISYNPPITSESIITNVINGSPESTFMVEHFSWGMLRTLLIDGNQGSEHK